MGSKGDRDYSQEVKTLKLYNYKQRECLGSYAGAALLSSDQDPEQEENLKLSASVSRR